MVLNVPERLCLLNIMPPAEGNIVFLRAVSRFREALGFTGDEAAEVGYETDGISVKWNPSKSKHTKDISVGPMVHAYVKTCLMRIAHAPTLREEIVNIMSVFFTEQETDELAGAMEAQAVDPPPPPQGASIRELAGDITSFRPPLPQSDVKPRRYDRI